MANEYSDLPTLKSQMGIASSDTTRDALLTQALTSASRAIDAWTGRRFYLDTSATARVYTVAARLICNEVGEEGLVVDDIGSSTGLIVETGIGGVYTPITDYEAEPENALVRGVAINVLRRPTLYWSVARSSRVRVTAKWGWPAVPAAITQAALIQAARIFRRKDSPEGVAGFSDLGVIRVAKLDPDVQSLIANLALPGFA